MNKEKEVRKVQKNVGNLGIRLRVVSYVGKEKFEKEKTIFSIREFYNIINKIKNNRIIYGIGVNEDCLIVHLFLDRPPFIRGDDVGEQLKEGGW